MATLVTPDRIIAANRLRKLFRGRLHARRIEATLETIELVYAVALADLKGSLDKIREALEDFFVLASGPESCPLDIGFQKGLRVDKAYCELGMATVTAQTAVNAIERLYNETPYARIRVQARAYIQSLNEAMDYVTARAKEEAVSFSRDMKAFAQCYKVNKLPKHPYPQG